VSIDEKSAGWRLNPRITHVEPGGSGKLENEGGARIPAVALGVQRAQIVLASAPHVQAESVPDFGGEAVVETAGPCSPRYSTRCRSREMRTPHPADSIRGRCAALLPDSRIVLGVSNEIDEISDLVLVERLIAGTAAIRAPA